MGRSKGPDKNRDAEGMLTREGVAANKAAKQLEKAQAAVDNQNKTKGRKSSKVAQTTAQNFLDNYNSLKDNKDKTRTQLSQLGRMNEQMGYNPTTGMGIGESVNFNTIGAGRDLRNIANVLGKLPTPMNIARQVLGGLTNVGSNLKTDFTNTANALSQFQQAPNLGVGIEGLYNNFLNSFNPEEEEEIAPNFNLQSLDQLRKPTAPAANLQINDPYSIYGGDFNALNFEPGVGQSSTTPEINISPGFRPNVLTYGGGLPVTYGTSDDDIMQGGYVGYSGTGPYSVDFNTMGEPFNRQEAGRRANRGPGDGPRIPLPGDFVDLPQPPGGDGGPEATPPPIGFGTIDPATNYNMLYGGFNQGGLVPPMSGPMSNGLGNLFKMK